MLRIRTGMMLSAAAAALAAGVPAMAAYTTTIAPVNGNDAFVYQFIPRANFVAPPFGPPPSNFNSILSTGRRAGHDTETYISFSLANVGIWYGQTAKLELWVTNNAPVSPMAPTFGIEPSPQYPVSTSVFAATSPFSATTVNFLNRPGTGALLDTQVIDGIDRWVSWDVTDQVIQWANYPRTNPNFGFKILQDFPVRNTADTDSVFVVYHSSRNVNRPRLVISGIPIPEPTGLLALAPLGILLRRGRR